MGGGTFIITTISSQGAGSAQQPRPSGDSTSSLLRAHRPHACLTRQKGKSTCRRRGARSATHGGAALPHDTHSPNQRAEPRTFAQFAARARYRSKQRGMRPDVGGNSRSCAWQGRRGPSHRSRAPFPQPHLLALVLSLHTLKGLCAERAERRAGVAATKKGFSVAEGAQQVTICNDVSDGSLFCP